MMKVLLLTTILLTTTSAASAGGNRALMEQAEARLRETNQKVLDHIPKESLPANGRLHIRARVICTTPVITLSDLSVSTTESPPISDNQPIDEPNH
jgi:hypothetical protein